MWKVSVLSAFLVRIFPLTERYFVSPYSVRMRENTDQKNSEYRHFSSSDWHQLKRFLLLLTPERGNYSFDTGFFLKWGNTIVWYEVIILYYGVIPLLSFTEAVVGTHSVKKLIKKSKFFLKDCSDCIQF